MRKKVFGLFGTGGFAREVMPIAKNSFELMNQDNCMMQFYFVETNPKSRIVNDVEFLTVEDFFSIDCDEKYFNVAIAESKTREKFFDYCIERHMIPLTIYASNAIIYEKSEISNGAILCANSVITSNAKIGKAFHCNIYSYIAHDCVIGDYVTFAPSVHCNGNVHIGNHAYVGTGAIIKQGATNTPLVIGEGAVVGMGAVVTKDVLPFTTVIGNPARSFER